MMTTDDVWGHFELRGFSTWDAERLARAALRGLAPDQVPGDFVVTARTVGAAQPKVLIVTSPVAALPYFYTVNNGELYHGSTVFDVVRAAGLSWRWNERAVRCLAWLGHTFGADTLHANVHRVPFDAVMRFEDGRLQTISRGFWRTAFGRRMIPIEEAVRVYGSVMDDMVHKQPVLAMSAGFDSRLLLARFLRSGIKPVLITMGHPESTDRIVATAIAKRYGLAHHIVELCARDYLFNARTISRLTSGTKTAAHWHTYLYSREAAGLAPGMLFGGTNGEFARTYYLDLGAPAQLFDRGPTRLAGMYFGARLERRRRRFHLPLPFLRETGPSTAASIARHIVQATSGMMRPLDAFDFFYASQRVRHFIGNGMALCSAFKPAVSPFLDARWIHAVGHLRRSDKMGSRFHRRAIADNEPGLLAFPVHGESSMARQPAPLYWLKRSREVGYGVFDEVIRLPQVREILIDSKVLDDLGPRSERERATRERHPESMEYLLTLHFAAESAREAVGQLPTSRGCAEVRGRQGH